MTADVKRFLKHCRIEAVKSRHAAILYPMADECRAGDGARCDVSYRSLGDASRMSRRSAIRTCAELAEMAGPGYENGLILVVARRRPGSQKSARNRYDLRNLAALGKKWEAEDARNAEPVEAETPFADDADGDTLTPTEGETPIAAIPDGDRLTPTVEAEADSVTNIGDSPDTNVGDKGVTPTTTITDTTTTTPVMPRESEDAPAVESPAHALGGGDEGTGEEEEKETAPTPGGFVFPFGANEGGAAAPENAPAEEGGACTPPADDKEPTGALLERLGVAKVGAIILACDEATIRRKAKAYEQAVADGADIGAGVLTSALLNGTEIRPARARRLKSQAPSRPLRYWLIECPECHVGRVNITQGTEDPMGSCPSCRPPGCGAHVLMRLVRELDASEVATGAEA